MKKRYILFIILIIIIICIIYIFFDYNKKRIFADQNELSKQNMEKKVENNYTKQRIDKIKEDLGYTSTSNHEIYEIKKEYDGREIIAIKPNIKYNVAMAGAIKNAKPEFSELDKLLEQAPDKKGIWITEDSREKVLVVLKEITNSNYAIDNNGYLVQEDKKNTNEIDKKLEQIIKGKKLYAIDIDKITYIVDEVTGNIEEYPFVEIDSKLPYELFETENASLYIINSNANKKLNDKDIIEDFLNSIYS